MEGISIDLVNVIKDYIIFKPKTKEELQEAVDLWCENRDEALNRYGNISLWDTSLITDMSYLFGFTKGYLYNKDNFNENDYEEYLKELSKTDLFLKIALKNLPLFEHGS